MKNLFFTVLTILAYSVMTYAQRGDLLVRSGDRGLFIEHKVAAKENFFSIGRLYTIHPKNIAAYNRLDMSKGLAIGQSLRIPLSDTNFIQEGNSGVPLYYRTEQGDALTKISKQHLNVSVDQLKSWNRISDNNIGAGKNLVVGFLVTKEIPPVTLDVRSPEKEVVKSVPAPEVKKDIPVIEKAVTEQAPPEKKPEIVQQTQPTPVFTRQAEKSEYGYFKPHFDQQIRTSPIRKNETVTAGVFKTTSGWNDAKYYLLIDGVQPGTIIRITNPANNKYIYAKVLGEMSGIRQNEGLTIRISSAAAAVLEIAESDKFIVKVQY
jgi:LysM repeat protein